jgi:hypothetical protein
LIEVDGSSAAAAQKHSPSVAPASNIKNLSFVIIAGIKCPEIAWLSTASLTRRFQKG